MKYFDFEETVKEIAAHFEGPTDVVGARNIAVEQGFPKAVQRAGFNLLKPDSTVDLSSMPEAIVIGVELWSQMDLRGLDSLANRLGSKSIPVFVFDLDEWFNAGELATASPRFSALCDLCLLNQVWEKPSGIFLPSRVREACAKAQAQSAAD